MRFDKVAEEIMRSEYEGIQLLESHDGTFGHGLFLLYLIYVGSFFSLLRPIERWFMRTTCSVKKLS